MVLSLLLAAAFAQPVVLVADEVVGPAALDVELTLEDGLPWLVLRAHDSLAVDWSAARLLAPDGSRGPFVLAERATFGPLTSTSNPSGLLAAGDERRWFIVPKAWVEDGPQNDAAQVESWSRTHFAEVTLPLEIGGEVLVHRSQWRTQPVIAPLPVGGLPPVVDRARRREWDLRWRQHRRAARSARSLWWVGLTAGVVGSAFSLAYLSDASRREDDAARRSQRNALSFGIAGGVGFALMVPAHFWEKAAMKRMRALGRRPR